MPYYIKKNHKDCKSGWAVVDTANDSFGCHSTKKSAIDQAIAISLSDKEPFMGERAAIGSLNVGDYVSWNVLDPEIAAEIIMIEGELAVVEIYEEEDGIFSPSDKMMIINVFKLEKIPQPSMIAEKIEPMQDQLPNQSVDTTQDEPVMRKADGDPIIISDIDDTLLRNGSTLITKTYDFIKTLEGSLFLLTGRPESTRTKTENDLESAGIRYSRLIMNTGSTADSAEFKKAKVEELLQTYDVVMAIENDSKTRGFYHELGIETMNPADITSDNSSRLHEIAQNLIARIESKAESKKMVDEVMTEARAKWLKAAYAIKAKLEGETVEGRSFGKTEIRTNHIEMRATGDGRTFEGYAAVFNEPSQPLPFIEYVKPGAFKRSLQGRHRMMLLWNHDTSNPLASTRNGSLKLIEDTRGLKVTATLPDTTLGRDVAELVRTGVVDSMSFGFSVKKDSWSADGQSRYLEDVSLWEVSLVSTPAYEGTAGTVSVRSINSISADDLADALLKIESGEELDPAQGELISDVISRLTKTPEVEEVDGDILALKKKKLDLLMMGL